MIFVVRSPCGDVLLNPDLSLSLRDLIAMVEGQHGISPQNLMVILKEDPGGEDGFQFVEELEEDGSMPADGGATTETAESSSEEDEQDPYWTVEKKKAVVDFHNANPGYTFKSMQQRFKRLTRQQFYEFKKQSEAGGTTKEKWQGVENEVKKKFDDARKDMLPIHNIDIRKWALDAASKHRLSTNVSIWWIHKFKVKYGIVSRRVSKIWNRAKLQRAVETEAAAVKFRQDVQAKLPDYDADMILNTDQSGYQYEFFSTRTLSYKGEHQTPIAIRSMNKSTHSYTIQPTLSLSGKLQSPLYLCTQETDGKMGALVEATYLRPPNVVVTCSKSGKLTTSHTTYYVDKVLTPMVTSDCLLLLDAWGGQKADQCFAGVVEGSGFEFERMCIPEGATATTQPLDVFYNRQWKCVVRKFYDYVQVQRLETVNIYLRDNIIKMQSLIHHLFSHDRFIPMGHYAFFASGLRPDRPPLFETPAVVLFPSNLSTCANCPKKAFIRCVYCNTDLCFGEFFEAFHNHMGFVPPSKEAIAAKRKAVRAALKIAAAIAKQRAAKTSRKKAATVTRKRAATSTRKRATTTTTTGRKGATATTRKRGAAATTTTTATTRKRGGAAAAATTTVTTRTRGAAATATATTTVTTRTRGATATAKKGAKKV